MKLELKHLAPYLPYGLKMNSYGRIYILDGFILESSLNVQDKPILRPLSDLIKEIEINGGIFIPVERVEEIFECDSVDAYLPVSIDYGGNIEIRYYQEFQKLFEWHFDVFGLIEKGLAIDINSIGNVS